MEERYLICVQYGSGDKAYFKYVDYSTDQYVVLSSNINDACMFESHDKVLRAYRKYEALFDRLHGENGDEIENIYILKLSLAVVGKLRE